MSFLCDERDVPDKLPDRLEQAAPVEPEWWLSAWCVVAAFGAYFCMYFFRRPFTAADFKGQYFGLDYKAILVIAQVGGYACSKFIGIKAIAEARPEWRAGMFAAMVGVAELALLGFGLTPAPYNLFWLFLNGLPLGMVFGLVLGFLEGRRQTEALAAALCTSFILADGAAKSVGKILLDAGVTEFWMPSLAGLIFAAPLLLFVWMLSRIPPPSPEDVAARSERAAMNADERWALFWRYATGLTLVVLVYLLITVLRSVRSDFAPEIWKGLNYTVEEKTYFWSEVLVAVGVCLLISLGVLLADNRWAFSYGLSLCIAGPVVIGLALVGLECKILAPFPFMVLHGIGLYLPYIAIHTTIFERLIAMTRERGNIGYLMYLADSFGYLGYVAVLLAKNLLVSAPGTMTQSVNFLDFFIPLSWVVAVSCLVLLGPCWWYFATHAATQPAASDELQPALTGGEAKPEMAA